MISDEEVVVAIREVPAHFAPPEGVSELARIALQNLGFEEPQIRKLAAGEAVAFILAGAAEGTICVARIEGSRFQIGIYTLRNVGGGFVDFATFEARAHAAARALRATELELMGVEINNSDLRVVLENGGFTPTVFPAPEELGGGTFDVLSRIEHIYPEQKENHD